MIRHILERLRLPFSGKVASADNISQEEAQNKSIDKKLRLGFNHLKAEKRKGVSQQSGKPSWYLMLGGPASGKTSLLHSAGLADLLSDTDLADSTDSIECLPTDYTMVVDTAGRYLTEAASHAQWLLLLKSLAKRKRGFPCGGIIVVLDIAKWRAADEPALAAEAKQLYRRLAEIYQALKQPVPIYLILSKCDELPGYSHLISAFAEAPQPQPWQICAPDRAPLSLSGLEAQLGSALQALRACRAEQVSQQRDLADKHAAYSFPEHFASITQKLSIFLKALAKLHGDQTLNLRALYFTSALQQSNQPLFDEIAVDQNTVSSTLVRYTNTIAFAAAAAAVFASIVLFQSVFSQHHATLKAGQMSLVRLAETATPFYPDDIDIVISIDAVFQHYQHLQAIAQQGSWHAYLGFKHAAREQVALEGFLIRILEKRFFKESALSLYDELDTYNRRWPHATQAEQEGMRGQYYDTLKACLMLEFAEQLDIQFVGNLLIEFWKTRLFKYGSPTYPDSRLTRQTLHDLAFFYLDHLKAESGMNLLTALIAYSDAIIREARRQLHVSVEPETLYERMVLQSRPAWRNTSISELMNAAALIDPREESAFLAIYTQRGWEEYAHAAIERVALEVQADDWVLHDPVFAHVLYTPLETTQESKINGHETAVSIEQLIDDIRGLYFRDYLRLWRHALSKLTFKPFASMNEAAKQLPGFLGPQGKIWEFIELLDRQFFLTEPSPSTPESTAEQPVVAELASLSAQLRRLILPLEGSDVPLIASPLVRLLEVHPQLQSLALSRKASEGALAFARDTLGEERQNSALYQSASEADFFLQGLGAELIELLTPILIVPIKRVWHLILDEAAPALNQRWQVDAYAKYEKYLKNYFPFQASSTRDDASLEQAVAFFHPERGQFWQFITEELADFIEQSPEGWEAKTWLGSGLPLSAQLLDALPYASGVREGLFSLNTEIPSLTFALYPFPTRGLREIKFVVNDQAYRYYNGPQAWQTFTWQYDHRAAQICIVVTLTDEKNPIEYCEEGPWAVARLMRSAQLSQRQQSDGTDNFLEAVWQIPGAEENVISIKTHFRVKDSDLTEKLFWNAFQLPELIV